MDVQVTGFEAVGASGLMLTVPAVGARLVTVTLAVPVAVAPDASLAVAVQVISSPGRLALVSAAMEPLAPVDQA